MLDAVASRTAKERGQQLAIFFDGEWTVAVLAELRAWLSTRAAAGQDTFTFEQFRHDAVAQPSTHKAWGSLPALACKEGLIAPMTHPDGSPVMRKAESVKTHSHPVRVWALSSHSASPESLNFPIKEYGQGERDYKRTKASPDVGEGAAVQAHSGSFSGLLGAVQAFHQERGAR